MLKFNVVLDTNIYRKNPKRSDLPFETLERLCKAGVLCLHLPYVVEREFQTQQIEQYQKDISDSLLGLKSIIRKGLPPAELANVQGIHDSIKTVEPLLIAAAEAPLISWAEAISAKRHPITESAAQSAMEAYFQGHPPFTKLKIRDDIPDAFIFQTIKDVSAIEPALIVLSEDGKLANAARNIPNVIVHNSLSAMIESEPIKAEILKLDGVERMEATRDLLPQDDVKFDKPTVAEDLKAIKNLLRKYEIKFGELTADLKRSSGEKLAWKTVHSLHIPDDNHEATITGCFDTKEIEFEFEDLYYFGAGKFGLPFSYRTTASLTYYIFKSDYYCLDEDRMPSVTDHNDHYYEAEEDLDVCVTGVLRISFPPEEIKGLTLDTLKDHIDFEIDSIDKIEVLKP
jgi:PIN domain